MGRFDHLAIPVDDVAVSRDWYVEVLGLEIEFEAPARRTVAVRDQHDFTIFLHQAPQGSVRGGFVLYFQVDDVEAFNRERSARGIRFDHEPKGVDWGYGAQLTDPSGYTVCLWDAKTMPNFSV